MRALTVLAASLLLIGSQAQAGGNAEDGKKKSASCAACHGADGNSTTAEFPRLAGQHADYLVKALRDYKTGARKNPIMAGFAAPLTAQDREDLAVYFASQNGLTTSR